MTDQYGPQVANWNVEQAVLATLRVWLGEYLADVERKNRLAKKALGRPANNDCYYGGLDFETELGVAVPPAVIVVVKPQGAPEKSASFYTGAYEVKVACVLYGSTEEEARQKASLYGAAVMGLLVEQGDLGGAAERTVMIGQPEEEWVAGTEDARRLIRSVTTFHTWVTEIASEAAGPVGPTPQEAPGYQGPEEPFEERPVVTSPHLTVEGKRL